MDRFETDPSSTSFDKAEFPNYPYADRPPYDATWVTAAEVSSAGADGLRKLEPHSWGTLGEFLDINIESGSMGREEVDAIVTELERDGRALIAGHVGTGIEIVRIEGPEAVAGSSPSP